MRKCVPEWKAVKNYYPEKIISLLMKSDNWQLIHSTENQEWICNLWQESFEKCWFLSLESMNFILHNIFPFFEQCVLTRATMRVRFWSKNLHTRPSGKISSRWRKYLAPSIFLKLHKSFLYVSTYIHIWHIS